MFLLAHAIALINEAALTRKLSVTFTVNSLILSVLKVLWKNNYISNYVLKHKGPRTLVTVYLFGSSVHTPLRNIKVVSTVSSAVSIKNKKLKQFFKNTSSSTLILTTPLGIITAQEALLKKVGGKILCSIN